MWNPRVWMCSKESLLELPWARSINWAPSKANSELSSPLGLILRGTFSLQCFPNQKILVYVFRVFTVHAIFLGHRFFFILIGLAVIKMSYGKMLFFPHPLPFRQRVASLLLTHQFRDRLRGFFPHQEANCSIRDLSTRDDFMIGSLCCMVHLRETWKYRVGIWIALGLFEIACWFVVQSKKIRQESKL